MACAAPPSLANQDRFICIYPAYLNNKKIITEGRRIPISKKNKMYSREWNCDIQYRDGSLCLVQFPSHYTLIMLYAAEMIPKLKTRTQKTRGGDQSLQQGAVFSLGKKKKKKEEERRGK
uniref:Signal recognition particle 19 kDa protein n=1 Tax=Cebus imitator TaxID=2715852 RepID=A0A2K5Q6C5_CEBIM